MDDKLRELRKQIDDINMRLLDVLSERAKLVEQIGALKRQGEMPHHDPLRESEQIRQVLAANNGPFSDEVIRHLFREVFRASIDLMHEGKTRALRVGRAQHPDDTVFEVGGTEIGRGPLMIAGPCAIESEEQMDATAAYLASVGVKIIRGGAHKPRTNPYSFQGMGDRGYRILAEAARRHGLVSISEVVDESGIEAAREIDILQIGARNMFNYRLLERVRDAGKPVLLKRGMAATYDELLLAAEYLAAKTDRIILCERGIRTFEPNVRNTLDITAVPYLRRESHLPVCVDISHAVGRSDLIAPLAKAAMAAGANLLMIEVHPAPASARSDSQQQIDFDEFGRLINELKA